MSKVKLHIVSFDVPYPPDYGGAIDVYYKIKALYEAGVEIYLHCFAYGRDQSKELEALCAQVWYYPRCTLWRGLSFKLPYIVYSRRNIQLLQRLQQIDIPILFEGIHTTYYLQHPSLTARLKMVRNHNIEHDYYSLLAVREQNLFKKAYYYFEAKLLKKYNNNLSAAQILFSISLADYDYFRRTFSNNKNFFLPPFHSNSKIEIKPGIGDYCLYHGNLAHPENKEAALYLLKNIIPDTSIPFVIAGRNPSKELEELCKKSLHCTLITNPSSTEMQNLIQNAHINVLPTFQATGMKLKLLNALFSGRHLLVNNDMVKGTGLEALCHIANSPEEFIRQLNILKGLPFTDTNIKQRTAQLYQYTNQVNAEIIIKALQQKFL